MGERNSRMLAQAVEAEAEAFLATMRELRLPDGRERVVRHATARSVWCRPGSGRCRCGV